MIFHITFFSLTISTLLTCFCYTSGWTRQPGCATYDLWEPWDGTKHANIYTLNTSSSCIWSAQILSVWGTALNCHGVYHLSLICRILSVVYSDCTWWKQCTPYVDNNKNSQKKVRHHLQYVKVTSVYKMK